VTTRLFTNTISIAAAVPSRRWTVASRCAVASVRSRISTIRSDNPHKMVASMNKAANQASQRKVRGMLCSPDNTSRQLGCESDAV